MKNLSLDAAIVPVIYRVIVDIEPIVISENPATGEREVLSGYRFADTTAQMLPTELPGFRERLNSELKRQGIILDQAVISIYPA